MSIKAASAVVYQRALLTLWCSILSALTACGGGGGGDSTTATTKVGGTVATGAPVAGSTVAFACQANQSFVSPATDSLGSYSVNVPSGALPCIASVTLSSGEVFRAFATSGSSVVNVTPLTELVVRKAGANPANYQQATKDTMQLLSTMQVQFSGDPTTTPFVPNGTGNDAVLLKLFPTFSTVLANGQSTQVFGANVAAFERVDPATYPAVMPPVDDPLWDAVKLGVENTLNDAFWGVGGYLDGNLKKSDEVAVEKMTKYALAVMFKQLAKKSLAKCISAGCEKKIVLGLANHFKSDALSTPATLLKDITTTPVELIVSTIFDSVADYFEQNLTAQLTSDGTLSTWDAIELGTQVYLARVAGHVVISELIGRSDPLTILGPEYVLLKAELTVGFDYAKQDIVNSLYIAKLTYDTAKENKLTKLQAQIFQARRTFRTDAEAAYAAWLLTNRTQDIMSDLKAKADATKTQIQSLVVGLPSNEQAIQTNLSSAYISKVLASYQKKSGSCSAPAVWSTGVSGCVTPSGIKVFGANLLPVGCDHWTQECWKNASADGTVKFISTPVLTPVYGDRPLMFAYYRHNSTAFGVTGLWQFLIMYADDGSPAGFDIAGGSAAEVDWVYGTSTGIIYHDKALDYCGHFHFDATIASLENRSPVACL